MSFAATAKRCLQGLKCALNFLISLIATKVDYFCFLCIIEGFYLTV